MKPNDQSKNSENRSAQLRGIGNQGRLKFHSLLLVMLSIAALATGCAQESGVAEVPGGDGTPCTNGCVIPVTPTAPSAPDGTGEEASTTGFSSGSTAGIKLTGGTESLARMFFKSNPNNPTNVRINMDLSRLSSSVIIRYYDNGKTVNAHFGVTHPTSNVQNSKYNGWVEQDGQSVWKGFFQDEYGAIIVVLNRMTTQGDGQARVGGSIWFQNFNQYWPNNPVQGPTKMCWEITAGPYDCRSFLANGAVNMTSSMYPENRGPHRDTNYEKLGEFDEIDINAAGL